MEGLEDKGALVTGASRGIGKGIAEGLASAGADVAINYPPGHDERKQAKNVAEEIQSLDGDGFVVEGDVRKEGSVKDMVNEASDLLNGIDVLVNNAGIISRVSFEDLSVETWDNTISVNLRGIFLVTRQIYPKMKERTSGKIINIASQRAFIGGEERVHYSASKGGVVGFTRALAKEAAPEINVNAVAPGPIKTDLVEFTEEEKQSLVDDVPMDRMGKVEEVVPTVLLLASDEGGYYAGQILSPDGGHAMH